VSLPTYIPTASFTNVPFFNDRVATGVTFKQAKGELVKKGWNPRTEAKGDKLYWLNGSTYQKLDEQSWASIESGRAKL
jgi:hypothetical protein